MKLKVLPLCFLMIFLFCSVGGFSQVSIDSLLKAGVASHDRGDFDEAIEAYKKALKIEAQSALVHYELAYSYFSKQEFKKAVKHCNIVLKQDSEYALYAYVVKGSCLDLMGKTKASIQLFNEAIKKTKGHFLLYYNLALNYYKLDDLEQAELNALLAIENNPNHTSSHLMLAHIHNKLENKIQAILASHYFLFLEPNSTRSKEAFTILNENMGDNVSVDPDKPKTINISVSPQGKDSLFNAAELMLSILAASLTLEENKDLTAEAIFEKQTQSLFDFLGTLDKDNQTNVWWSFYTPFFYRIAQSEHFKTYCNYIKHGNEEQAALWLENNQDALKSFDAWLRNQ